MDSLIFNDEFANTRIPFEGLLWIMTDEEGGKRERGGRVYSN